MSHNTLRYAYPYKKLTGIASNLLVYTGEPIKLEDDEEIPANASQWKPQITEGRCAYFDGFGWRAGPDISEVSLEKLKKVIAKRKLHEFTESVDSLNSEYSKAESQSWGDQLAEAKKIIADGYTPGNTPLIEALAEARKIDKLDFARKVIDKNAEYQAKYAILLAEFQKERDMIEKAKSANKLPLLTLEDLHYL